MMEKVYSMTYRRQILGESVSNSQKLFSIHERHTDIIVKGGRDVLFGHKVNLTTGKSNGITNIVFNKVTKSLKNIASSLKMETRLKKWRSGIEAVISNLKRGFDLRVCIWKGFEHFKAKVMWSVLAYNFRVLTNMTLSRIAGLA